MKKLQGTKLFGGTNGKALVAVALMAGLMATNAHAGTGGTEFDDVWLTLTDWTQGTLGRIIAGSMILIGIVGGIARQSMMAFAIGIASGMGLYYSPDIVDSIMVATLPQTASMGTTLIQIGNGLGM